VPEGLALNEAADVLEGLTLTDGLAETALHRPLAAHPVMGIRENIILHIGRSQHIHIHIHIPMSYLICMRLSSMRPPPTHAERLFLYSKKSSSASSRDYWLSLHSSTCLQVHSHRGTKRGE
jgi:hypothetical protein